jgi:signal peptidase I
MAKKQYDYFTQLRWELHIKIRNTILYAVVVIAFVTFVLHFLTFPVIVQSVSMEPDFKTGSFAFVTPLVASVAEFPVLATIDRGDVVLVSHTETEKVSFPRKVAAAASSFFMARRFSLSNTQHLVSLSPSLTRVVGMPGDTIYMKDQVLYVKPQSSAKFYTEFELSKKKYNTIVKPTPLDWNSAIGVAGQFSEITLKANEYFFLSDNRSSSVDSRLWGPVGGERIVGKAWLRYLPLDRFAKL